jgi:hypothetical protein
LKFELSQNFEKNCEIFIKKALQISDLKITNFSIDSKIEEFIISSLRFSNLNSPKTLKKIVKNSSK